MVQLCEQMTNQILYRAYGEEGKDHVCLNEEAILSGVLNLQPEGGWEGKG